MTNARNDGALRGLVDSGASCGTANPLMKLTTHYTKDRAKQDDGILSRRPTNTSLTKAQNGELVDEFLHNTGARPKSKHQHIYRPPQTFRMDTILQEMQGRHEPRINERLHDKEWSSDFLGATNHKEEMSQGYPTTSTFKSGKLKQPMLENEWASEYLQNIPLIGGHLSQYSSQAWESEFEHYSENKQMNPRQGIMQDASQNWSEQFLDGQIEDIMQPIASEWVEEFSSLTVEELEHNKVRENEKTYQQDFWKNLETEWKKELEDNAQSAAWLEDFDGYVPYEQYEFVENNPLKNHNNCLEEGKKKLEEGDVPSAVLLFEVSCKQEPENPEAWFLLGTSQAKNEQDPLALAALRKSLKLQPNNLEAILSLAASFTNESYQAHACHALQDWITMNPDYNQNNASNVNNIELGVFTKPLTSSFMSKELHDETIDMYLKAARQNHIKGKMDADVQSGLGILFNLSGDYEKAVDCFRSALNVNPDDAQLWNRLGATLANGNRSEEAVNAYREALNHSPGFVRARYNLGISCINLRSYSEAAEHFLEALNFQAAGRGPHDENISQLKDNGAMSDNIWSSMRLTLSLMGRRDLYEYLDDRNLEKINQILKQ